MEDELSLSNCCDAHVYWYTDICSNCKEHCITHWDVIEQKWEDSKYD